MTEKTKTFSKLFYEFLSYPELKSDAGSSMDQETFKSFLKQIKNSGNAVEFKFDVPVKLQYTLDGHIQDKTWSKPYWQGSPTFLIILSGRQQGKILLYDDGHPDPAFIFYYPLVNFSDFKSEVNRFIRK